ncbi:MAG: apolipoprotein N-acyltransferase [Rhabdaerophilum sp.]
MALGTFFGAWRESRFSLAFLAEHIILLAGWPRWLLALVAGAVASLALQPVNVLPALAFAFPVLVWLMDGLAVPGRRRLAWQAFSIGWCFGFGYFLAGLWWLGVAFVIGGEQFIWLLPLGVIGLPAGLAIFTGLGIVLARALWSSGALRVFTLAFALGLSEFARASILTGFPWNGFGQVFADHLVLAQGASLIGAEGLGLFAILVFAAPATLGTGRGLVARWTMPALAVLLIAALAGFGFARLIPTGGSRGDLSRIAMVPDVKLRIVQPNVAQEGKNRAGSGAQILERFLQLSDRPTGPQNAGLSDVTHLFWPEAPFPFVLDREPKAIEAISQQLAGGTVLVTGAIRAEEAPDLSRRYRFFNSIQVLNRDGILGTYDKAHLVPFGEYLPFERLLRSFGLQEFVHVIGGFSASRERKPLDIPGLPGAVPVICFETIFPRELAPSITGSAVFVNVTNDAWFGRTPGPYQHLAQARLRSIEFGQPMVRAANSGVSAVIDPYGRILVSLPLNRADIVDSPLPAGLAGTLYSQTIWYSYATVMILFAALGFLGKLRDRFFAGLQWRKP